MLYRQEHKYWLWVFLLCYRSILHRSNFLSVFTEINIFVYLILESNIDSESHWVGVVVHTLTPATQEVEIAGSQISMTLSQNKKRAVAVAQW